MGSSTTQLMLPFQANSSASSWLGASLGRFDLQGQLQGIESVRAQCRKDLAELEDNRDQRLRSYQTLGLCAGCALAILFL